MSSNFVKIPPSFEKKNEVVEERIVSNDSGVIYLVNMDKENTSQKVPKEIASMHTGDYYGNTAHYSKGSYNILFILKTGIRKEFSLLDNNITKFNSFSSFFDFIGEKFDFNFEEFCNYYNL